MAPQDDPQAPSGFSLWFKNAREGSNQIFRLIHDAPQNYRHATKVDKAILFSFGGLAVAVTTLAGILAGPAMAGIQALGFLSSGASLLNQRLQFNHHKLAVQPAISGGMAVQQLLLGGFGYAVMAGIAAGRSWIFAMIPEDKKYGTLRTGIALGFAGAGIAGIAALSLTTGRLANLLTIPSMLMGTIADRMPSSTDPAKDHTRFARLLRCIACANNALFNAVVSGSWAGLFNDTLATANLRSAIRDYDVPTQNENGKPLTRKESLSRYARSLFTAEPPLGLTPHQVKNAVVVEAQKIVTDPATTAQTAESQNTLSYRIPAADVAQSFDRSSTGIETVVTANANTKPDNLPKKNIA